MYVLKKCWVLLQVCSYYFFTFYLKIILRFSFDTSSYLLREFRNVRVFGIVLLEGIIFLWSEIFTLGQWVVECQLLRQAKSNVPKAGKARSAPKALSNWFFPLSESATSQKLVR